MIGVRSLAGSEATCTLNGATYNRCFTYDLNSRLLSAYNPEAGTTSYAYDQDTNCTPPNSFPSQLVSKTDARGNRTCVQYDNLNRVTQKNYPSSTTPTVTYSYDSTNCLDVPPVPCYNLNRRTGMTDGSGQTNWAYDAVGNVLEEKRTIGTSTKKIFYTYNLDSSIKTIQYPSGRTITYQPGDAQRPLSAVDSGSSINYATLAHYAPPGGLASLTNGGSFYFTAIFNNRLQPCWAYATTGAALAWNSTNTQFCTTSAATGSVIDMKFNFNWGAGDNGNVMGITNNRDSTRSQAFTYDNLNRILTAQTTSTYSTSANNCWAEQYSVDPVGNLKSIAATGNSAYNGCHQESGFTIVPNGNNQIGGFCYDAAGDLQAQSASPCPSPTYVYDAEGRMTTSTAGVTTYTYDGDGKRVMKSNGTLYWYGTGGDTLAETDASGNTTNEYIFFGGKRIARRDSSNNVFYYFADQLGTARETIQAGSTSPCYDADFYPYGGERVVVDTCDSHYKFTGKERDTESGLDNFGARYDSSQFGRFMTPDWSATPTGVPYAVLGDPQSLNLYAYVRNNPLAKADPDGHCALCKDFWNFFFGPDTPPPPPPPPSQGGGYAKNQKFISQYNAWYKARYGHLPPAGECPTSTCHTYNGTLKPLHQDKILPANLIVTIVAAGSGVALAQASAVDMTPLYRAVGPNEAESISSTNSFLPSPKGTEYKGFFYSYTDAQSFAARLTQFTGQDHTVVSATAPTDLVLSSPQHSAATEGSGVLIHSDNLHQVTPTD